MNPSMIVPEIRRRLTLTAPVIAALVLSLAGCDAPAPVPGGDEWTGSISDSADVSVVVNPPRGLWGPSDRWGLVEELSISDGAIPGLDFGRVGDLAVDSRGRILVLDELAKEVHLFSAGGEYLQTLGGAGSGPGEFADPIQVLVLPGDSILVPDLGNTRASVFGPDGSLARSFPVDPLDLAARRWAVAGAGDLVARRSGNTDALLRLDRAGEVRDTVARLVDRRPVSGTEFVLLAPIPVWGARPSGDIAYGHSHEYRITVIEPDRTARLVFTRPLDPPALSESERDLLVDGLRAALAERAPPEMVDQFLAGIAFNEELPLIADVMGGPQGTFWIQRASPPAEMRIEALNIYRTAAYRSGRWDVFDADGRYLGEVELPENVQLVASGHDRLFGLRRDEFDVPSIVRFRVESGQGATETRPPPP